MERTKEEKKKESVIDAKENSNSRELGEFSLPVARRAFQKKRIGV